MRIKQILIISASLALLTATPAWAQNKKAAKPQVVQKVYKDKAATRALAQIDADFATYDALQKQIWRLGELGFLEHKSAELLENQLESAGFSIEKGVADMPSAFTARFGSGKPVIGILAEYDALPGLSQDTVPYRKPLEENGSGHGCGHNAFGVGSVAGAIAISQWLTESKQAGTVVVYGTPAEEGGGGKVYMARDGVFADADVVFDWHPASSQGVSTGLGTAMTMVDFRFYGKSAHAAGSPWKGRSALDGVEALDYMVNLLREHVPASSRIHYVIANGGEAPNVVPEYARVSYYIRSPKRETLAEIQKWIFDAADAAALGTQTRVEKEIICGYYEKLPNRLLQQLLQDNLEHVGAPVWDDREIAFANEIKKTLDIDVPLENAFKIQPLPELEKEGQGGSSDVGDVSWVVPNAGFGTATFVPGSAGHSWQNVAVDGTTIGTKSAIVAGKVFALSAIELFLNPKLIEQVKQEFNERRGNDFVYKPLLGDRRPAYDYRKK
ncbi:MAG: amidohydrolase [Bacteroidales bacterium]|nr:amidohydrolase [Bacteroidales bacterium]